MSKSLSVRLAPRAVVVLCSFALAGLVAGCPPPTSDAGPGPEPQEDDTRGCDVDPDVVAQDRACLDDDQCPCGTSCILGRCGVPECSTSEDCPEAERCDSFGRCRAQIDVALIEPVEPAPEPELAVRPQVVTAFSGLDGRFEVRGIGGGFEQVRVEATRGAEVQCPGEADFTTECMLSVEAGATAPVTVRGPSAGTYDIRVFAGRQARSVTFVLEDEPVLEMPPLAGTYRGSARLVAHGLGLAERQVPEGLDFSIELEIAEGMTGEFSDELGWLLPGGAWAGNVTFSEETNLGTLDLPGAIYLEGTRAEYQVQLAPQMVAFQRAPGGMLLMEVTFEYVGVTNPGAEYGGVIYDGGNPWTRWSILFTRTGDVPAGSPPHLILDPPAPGPVVGIPLENAALTGVVNAISVSTSTEPTVDGLRALACLPTGTALDMTHASRFTPNFGTVSGDVHCSQPGTGLASDASLAADMSNGLTVEELMDACLDDAADLNRAGQNVEAVAEASNGCLHAGRQLLLTGFISLPNLASEGLGIPLHDGYYAVAHRAVQQWLEVQDFVARESAQREAILAVTQGASAVAGPEATLVLSRLVGAWDLLLYPRYGGAIAAFSDQLLAEPDYRPRLADLLIAGEVRDVPDGGLVGEDLHEALATAPTGEQKTGLPVTIIEALKSQFELTDMVLERAALEGDKQGADDAAALAHRAFVVHALAAGLTQRTSDATSPTWLGRYERSERTLHRALRSAYGRSRALLRGENPLGISDSDLPLYFRADTVGADNRFSAISDFLITGTNAWVPLLIDQADEDLVQARDAYVARQEREIQIALELDEIEEAANEVAADYGDRIAEVCGLPAGISSFTVLDQWSDFNGNLCHVREDRPEFCDQSALALTLERFQTDGGTPDAEASDFSWPKLFSRDDIEFQICRHTTVRDNDGVPITFDFFRDSGLRELGHCATTKGQLEISTDPAAGFSCPGSNAGDVCVRCPGGDIELVDERFFKTTLLLNPTRVQVDVAETAGDDALALTLEAQADVEEAARGLWCRKQLMHDGYVPSQFELERTAFEAWTLALTGQAPGYRIDPPPDFSRCFRGAIGQTAIQLNVVSTDIQIAYARFLELSMAYDIAVRGCRILDERNMSIEEAEAEHDEIMEDFGDAKVALEAVANYAAFAKDCAGGLSIDPIALVGGLVSCGGGALESTTTTFAGDIEQKMDNAERAHGVLIERIRDQTEFLQCMSDADLHMVEARSRSLEINRAMLELSVTLAQYENEQFQAQRLYDEGQTALQVKREQTGHQFAFSFWLDEYVDDFLDSMSRARRATYVAVRAIEYERQESSVLRADVLEAKTPSQLRSVLRDLQATALTRGIEGSRPNQLSLVVSLKQHLLQIPSYEVAVPGERNLTETERFRLLVQSRRWAEHNEQGEYIGQRIPFTIAPLAELELGDASGIPVFADADCGERIWSLNGSIQGTGALFRGQPTSSCSPDRCRFDIQASNTFYSQWCNAEGRDTPFQVGSVRPSRNLLSSVDPFGSSQARDFSIARLGTALNVSAEALGEPSYTDGASSELATRGLFAQYAVFIPATSISLTDGESYTDGLVLDEVDDILVRIDYTSVAK